MKNYIILTIIFLSQVSLFSQSLPVPDTVYLEQPTDSTYRVVREYTFDNGGTRTDKTEPLDSAGALLLLGNVIHDNELVQVRGVRDLKAQQALSAIYSDVNAGIDSIAGKGYLQLAFEKFGQKYVGFWTATIGQTTVIFQLKNDGTAIQVDNQGTPVEGGYSGTWNAISNQSFWLVNFLPSQFYPNRDRIVSIAGNSDTYFHLNGNIIFKKVQ